MTRAEHVRWCKTRALEYVDRGDFYGAMASMLSDLGKHDETRHAAETMAPVALFELRNPREESVRRFITGFTE